MCLAAHCRRQLFSEELNSTYVSVNNFLIKWHYFLGAEIHLNKKENDQDCNVPLYPTVLQTKHTAVVFPNIILNPTVLQTKHTAVVFLNITLHHTVLQMKRTVVVLPHAALNIHHSTHFQINITDLGHVSTLSCSCIRHQSTAKYELQFVMFQIPVRIIRTGYQKRSY